MGIASLIIGIVALVPYLVTALPLLGWMVWLVIALAGVGVFIGIIGLIVGLTRGTALWDLILNIVVVALALAKAF